jgi:hydrogenase-4 component B
MFNFSFAQMNFFITLALLFVGAFGSLLVRKSDALANWWGNIAAILAACFGLMTAISVLFFGMATNFNANSTLPLLTFSLRIDPLSAFFIFIISLITILASIYGIDYVKHYYGKYNIGTMGFFYNLFIAGMLLVVSANNALFFLLAWELMSCASYFLVIFENKETANVRAGSLYFIMTHIGTAFIMLAFLLLYSVSGSFDFTIIKENLVMISPLMKDIVFLLMLIGFGTKAGIIPLHIWLPSAHPAAPSHVSALMSGVMIKTGIYMFIRIFIDILPGAPLWWGELVLLIGAVSALAGVLYALTEHDIKRLLAYHSIENIGIILLGVGSSLIFLTLNLKELAILALVAALFHTLNHAIFKALLFMGAGSVISKMHTRNMEEYGGIIKYMPQTAFFFLIGSLAISALPPFNGFFSEWMTYQALFFGIAKLNSSAQWLFILATGSLAFTGGLAAACFVKAFGATFLARSRSKEVEHIKEAGIMSLIGMGVLATATLILGIFAYPVSKIILNIVSSLDIFGAKNIENNFVIQGKLGTISMPIIFISVSFVLILVFILISALTKKRKTQIGCTWDCGTNLTPRMEITATGFSRSIVVIFRGILRPTKQNTIEYRDADMRYFAKKNLVKLEVEDFWGTRIYQPLQNLVAEISNRVKLLQGGNINIYILYIFLTLLLLVLVI